MSKVILTCVKENRKLRIRFHSFKNDKDEIFTNVYNNEYNCRFPRDIRKEGAFYEIGPNDITLQKTDNKKPFYIIKKQNIKNCSVNISDFKLFKVDECVICLDNDTDIAFLPCGHVCTCSECSCMSKLHKCPLCRRPINDTQKI